MVIARFPRQYTKTTEQTLRLLRTIERKGDAVLTGRNDHFAASYDLTTKIVSAIVVVILLAVAAAVHNIFVGCLTLLVLIFAFAYSPRAYVISERAITVGRLIGNVLVPMENVREARRSDADDLRGCVRLWGSGGLFGYYGLFTTTKLGRCTWYVTNRKNMVVIVAESKTTLYSPDDVDGFLETIRASVPVPKSSGNELFANSQRARGAGRVGRIFTAAAIATAIAALLFAFMYSPGAPSYTLTAHALTIHDRFYPVTLKADSVDVSRIRVVDLTQEPGWRPTKRTNGFANTQYRSGWFRVENGRTVLLYQTNKTRLVLLPPTGADAPVLYEAKEPEKFMQDVRDEWARTP